MTYGCCSSIQSFTTQLLSLIFTTTESVLSLSSCIWRVWLSSFTWKKWKFNDEWRSSREWGKEIKGRETGREKKDGTFSCLIKPKWKACLIDDKEVACKEAHGWRAQAESRRDLEVTFMAPVHQTPPYPIASLAGSLLDARACDLKVSLIQLLAG